jgi:hypothetical protein
VRRFSGDELQVSLVREAQLMVHDFDMMVIIIVLYPMKLVPSASIIQNAFVAKSTTVSHAPGDRPQRQPILIIGLVV